MHELRGLSTKAFRVGVNFYIAATRISHDWHSLFVLTAKQKLCKFCKLEVTYICNALFVVLSTYTSKRNFWEGCFGVTWFYSLTGFPFFDYPVIWYFWANLWVILCLQNMKVIQWVKGGWCCMFFLDFRLKVNKKLNHILMEKSKGKDVLLVLNMQKHCPQKLYSYLARFL